MIIRTAYSPDHGTVSRAIRSDARPLYIAPERETRVDLDGPALRVRREETAEQLFPLQRISRVYSAERVDWTSEALLACADRGIGVLFVDNDGQVVARVLGRPGQRDEMYHRLTELLLLPQGMEMYLWWLNDATRRATYWAGLKLGIPAQLRDPRRSREWIHRKASRYAGATEGERSWQWLRSLAYNWMQGHLHDLGFGRDNELAIAGEPPLARDLTEVLVWYLEPARLGWLRARHQAALRNKEKLKPVQRPDLVRLFESRAMRVSARGREITGYLHRWMIHNT